MLRSPVDLGLSNPLVLLYDPGGEATTCDPVRSPPLGAYLPEVSVPSSPFRASLRIRPK